MKSTFCHQLMLAACVLVTGFAAATNTRSSGSNAIDRNDLRAYFMCDQCNPERCLPVSPNCRHSPVMELGVCACCQVCPLGEGDACGVYTKPCAEGTRCVPSSTLAGATRRLLPSTVTGKSQIRRLRSGDDGVRSLFYGEGKCLSDSDQKELGDERFPPRRFRV